VLQFVDNRIINKVSVYLSSQSRDQHVTNNVVKQWYQHLCTCISANGGCYKHLLWTVTFLLSKTIFSC